jgi:ferredoxin
VNAAGQHQPATSAEAITVTVTLRDRTVDVLQRGDSTILQLARGAGLRVPSSCELGNCGACIARVIHGRVAMHRNEVLTSEEVDDGWILGLPGRPEDADRSCRLRAMNRSTEV